MDLQTRKIAFVQEFLSVESEEMISRLEQLLKNEKDIENEFRPMTMEEFQERIDQSMEDSKMGRVTEMNDFLAEIEKWD